MIQAENLRSARFLIVDDEQANIGVLTKMLKQWGATNVLSTTDPCMTVSLFNSHAPDMVLLDLMMPELDGFQVMEQLKLIIDPDNYLPILVLTADTTHETRRAALAGGATDFLTKPFDAAELSLRIHNLLQTRFLYQNLQSQNKILDEKVQMRTQQLEQAEIDTVECLALAAEYRDDDTGQHTQRVGYTAALLAEALGMESKKIDLIRRAAPLHDVGKIGISDSILLKPGALTQEEFAIMKTHAVIGAEIMARHHTPLLQLAASIARTHHERWNGKGYPHGLAGEDIPIEGRIVAVADVFDALTHERPYKAAWPVEEAVAEIKKQSGQQFAPEIVEVFLKMPHQELL